MHESWSSRFVQFAVDHGNILFMNRTKHATEAEPVEQAVSGRDYVAIQSTGDMTDGVTRLPVEVTILAVCILPPFLSHAR